MLTSTVDIMPKLLTHQWLANKFFSTNEQTKKDMSQPCDFFVNPFRGSAI